MFHSAKDGKGFRHVYVNGNRIDCVLWANEEQGLVCFMPKRRMTKRDIRKGQIYTRLLRGNVGVEFIHETTQTAKQTTGDNTKGTETN
ncbi:hypothetical protein [Acinetobacter sp. F-1]|uniref:hypothetical protein n=1 Tax=Acinetobacter sp. F-1 TaxID=1796981 RepID=UPI001FCFA8E0|nr:hypothetical protein [Acinetobacter sp. F-1]